MRLRLLILLVTLTQLGAASAVEAQDCPLCASKVVVMPETAPCLVSALDAAKANPGPFVTFDLSKCAKSAGSRGVVPGLPSVEDLKAKPTLRFVVQKAKLSCLAKKYESVRGSIDPYALITLSDCE